MAVTTDEKTNIEVFVETWQRLKARKTRPGDSFDDVINSLIDEVADDAAEEAETDGTGEDTVQEQEYEDPINEILDEWSPTRRGDPDEKKRKAAREGLELLRDRGHVSRGIVRSRMGEELPNPGVTEDTYWQTYVRPAFSLGRELGYIELQTDTKPQQYVWHGQ